MYIHDLNSKCEKTILLIHPMLTNAKELKKTLVDRMKLDDVRIIIPDLSGHGKSRGVTYESSSKEASMLHRYFKAKGIGEIKFAFGASLGSNIIFELLKYKDIQIDSVIMEGASAFENSYIKSFFYAKTLIGIKNLGKLSENTSKKILSLSFNKKIAAIMADELQSMSKESIENMVKDYASVDLPYLRRRIQENLNFYYGTKDSNIKHAEKRLKSLYPKANFFEWPYFKHCEKIYREPRSYAEILKSYL